MRKVLAIVTGLVTVLVASTASADYTAAEIKAGVEQCEKSPPVQQIELNVCANYQALSTELRLTRAYRAYRGLVKEFGNPGDAEHLLKVQRAWIAYRELRCESRDEGSMVPMEHWSCMGSMASERAQDLEIEIQNECDRSCGTDSKAAACAACAT